MFIRKICRSLVLGVILFGGSILGMPLRPEELEELLYNTNRVHAEMVIEQSDKTPDRT